MSHGEELLELHQDMTTRPSFVVALRGYDKRQVDEYVAQVDSGLSALVAERVRARGHIQDLAGQLSRAQSELAELHQRPPQIKRASFRDLGPTVDEILALAEKQAREITETAAQRAADQRAEADRMLAEARREAEATRAQTQQEIQARKLALTQMQTELDAARQDLAQARQEASAAEREFAQLQQRLGEVGQELAGELDRLEQVREAAAAAERDAKEIRARVQREAERVAQLAAAAVMAAAARGAETGEYPMVVPVRSGANGTADEAPAPPAGEIAPDSVPATGDGGYTGPDNDSAGPTLRRPQPGEIAAEPG